MSIIIRIIVTIVIPSCIVRGVTVERLTAGDVFDAPCNSCHLYEAVCADGSIHLFDCCYKCSCELGATVYNGMCYSNIPQEQLQCKIFVENDEFFGLKTHDISMTDVTVIGHIKDKWYWNRKVFYKCVVGKDSTYWDTKEWRKLFTNGRRKSHFQFEGGNDGVLLKGYWNENDKWQLYTGLLIKLSVTCHSKAPIPQFGLNNQILSYFTSRQDDQYTLKSCLVIKFAGRRTYYDGTMSPTTEMELSTSAFPPFSVTKDVRKTTLGHGSTTSSLPVSTTATYTYAQLNITMPHSTSTTTVTNTSRAALPTSTTTRRQLATTNTVTPQVFITGVSYDEFCRVIVPIACLAGFLVVVACVTYYCSRRRYPNLVGKKNELIDSYGSTDTESLLNSNEYAIIRTPTYSDIWELENWDKTRKKDGNNVADEKLTKTSWKDCSDGVDYQEARNHQSSIIAQESITQDSLDSIPSLRQPSESSWNGTLYMLYGNQHQ